MFNVLLLRTLPVQKPEQLVALYRTGGWGRGFTSYPLYLQFRERRDLFEDVLARSGVWRVRFSATRGDRVDFVNREFVSGNYFEVLGVTPALGRLFTDDDDRRPQGHPLAVLGYDFWRSRFGLDPGILGRVLVIDEQPLTVVGVARPGFRGVEVDKHADLWVPIMMNRGTIADPRRHWLWLLARSKPGLARGQVQAAADTIMQQHLAGLFGDRPDSPWRRNAMEQRIEVRQGGIGISLLRDQFGKPLGELLLAVAVVLAVACANVANLLLARGAARPRSASPWAPRGSASCASC